MVLDLPSEIWVQVDAMARERGVNLSQYAVARNPEAVNHSADYEISGFADENDTPISAEEAAFLREGTLRGLEAEAQGRYRPATDVFNDLEAKYGLSRK